MTRIWVNAQAVDVRTNSRGQPAIFELYGCRYVVARIIQQWEVHTDWWTQEGKTWRRHYAVITRENNMLWVLCYDVLADTWQLDKV